LELEGIDLCGARTGTRPGSFPIPNHLKSLNGTGYTGKNNLSIYYISYLSVKYHIKGKTVENIRILVRGGLYVENFWKY